MRLTLRDWLVLLFDGPQELHVHGFEARERLLAFRWLPARDRIACGWHSVGPDVWEFVNSVFGWLLLQ